MSESNSGRSAPGIENLSDELLLIIFSYLRPNSRPQTTRNANIDTDVDSAGKKDLLNVCLTSRRFLVAATPALYADIHIRERDPSNMMRQMGELLFTIKRHPERAKFIKVIRYNHILGRRKQGVKREHEEPDMEVVMTGGIGPSHFSMVQDLSNPHMAELWWNMFCQAPLQAQLLLLLWLSPNISELTLGTYDGPLSRILGLDHSSHVREFHGYKKLNTIIVITEEIFMPTYETDSSVYPELTEPDLYDDHISTFEHLPALRYYHHMHPHDVYDAPHQSAERLPFWGDGLRNLRTLHLVDCDVSMDQVLKTVRPCRFLSEFRFRPYSMVEDMDRHVHLDFGSIFEALLPSKDTLRYLSLSMGYNNSMVGRVDSCNTVAIGTLQEFTELQTLVVPAIILTEKSVVISFNMEDVQSHGPSALRIVENLPTSIALLGLSNDHVWAPGEGDEHMRLADEAAQQLLTGLERLPNLQAVYVLQDLYHTCQDSMVHLWELEDRCAQKNIEYVVQDYLGDDQLLFNHYEMNM